MKTSQSGNVTDADVEAVVKILTSHYSGLEKLDNTLRKRVRGTLQVCKDMSKMYHTHHKPAAPSALKKMLVQTKDIRKKISDTAVRMQLRDCADTIMVNSSGAGRKVTSGAALTRVIGRTDPKVPPKLLFENVDVLAFQRAFRRLDPEDPARRLVEEIDENLGRLNNLLEAACALPRRTNQESMTRKSECFRDLVDAFHLLLLRTERDLHKQYPNPKVRSLTHYWRNDEGPNTAATIVVKSLRQIGISISPRSVIRVQKQLTPLSCWDGFSKPEKQQHRDLLDTSGDRDRK